jgi:uncharacterized protein (TIRG00374 family)
LKANLRTALRLTLGIGVSLACLYFATSGTDWSRVRAVLAGARPGWAIALVVASLWTIYIRAQRWCVLLRPLGDVSLYPSLSATAIGFGASTVLPLRLGELVRPALLGRRTGVGVLAALSSVVLERLFDMLLVALCFVVTALTDPRLEMQAPTVARGVRSGAYVVGALAVVGLTVLLVVQRRRKDAERFLERRFNWLPQRVTASVGPLVVSFMNGLAALGDTRTVLVVLAYSAYLWGVIVLTFLFAFLSLGMNVPLLSASLATMVGVAFAVALPQGPGFIGTWQAGCVFVLSTLFGVPQDAAVAYSVFTWILQMVVNIGGAAFFVVREGVSLGQLLHTTDPVRQEG